MSDQIIIRNLEVFARHGVFPEENKLGQKFLIDAVLQVDTRKAGVLDDLKATVDYGAVCHFITKYLQEHTFHLVEAALEHLAEAILLEIPLVRELELSIQKPWAPIGLPLQSVGVRITRGWHTVYLSVGSNLGDRVSFIQFALDRLSENARIRNLKVSSLLETEPYGYVNQAPFVNGAIRLQTLYQPEELLELLHRIEAEAGRERKIHWGPRTLDLDIIFYDDLILEETDLIVPHVDMANRMFVLAPLAELCPGKVHPVLHKTVAQMHQELKAKGKK